jgi:hypothetical protein
MNTIPQHATQHVFDFDALDEQPIEIVPPSANPAPSQERQIRKDFYTYRLIRSDTCLPFYIGKGQKSRITAHISNAKHHGNCNHRVCNTIRKLWREGYEVIHEKIAEGITEKSALALEKFYIALGGIYGWPLVNLTLGGEIGPTGRVYSAEERQKRGKSLAKAMANPEVKQTYSRARKKLWQNEEFRAKRKAALDAPEIRKKMGDRIRGKANDDLAKTYPGFISPDGTVYKDVFNLHTFCQEHNLQISNMCLVAQGKQYAHKGWTCYPPIEKPAKKAPAPKFPYTGFVSPHDGKVYHVTSTLKDFCKEHGLNPGAMSYVNSKVYHSYKGWTKYNP